MPRRARPVHLKAIPAPISEQESIRRVARAAEVLLRIQARIDAQTAPATDLPEEKDDCPRKEQPPS